MGFVHDEKADVLDVLPLLPASRQYVPFIRGADNDVTFAQELQICAGFPSQQHHLLVQDVLELLVPVDKHLTGSKMHRGFKTGPNRQPQLGAQGRPLREVPARPELP